jgi:hypothetical protein
MTPYEIVSVVMASLGLIGGVIGSVRAQAASRRSAAAEAEAADAQSDSAAALKKSAEATERIADAIEIIAKRDGVATRTASEPALGSALRALLPPHKVAWALQPRMEPGSYRLRNIGTITATAVTVTPLSGEAAGLIAVVEHPTLEPGVATVVRIGRAASVESFTVGWHDVTTSDELHATVNVRQPTG